MANKNKKIETRVSDEFFNQMEAYKNKHNVNWSSKIRAFIENEMTNDINSIQELKNSNKEVVNLLLDKGASIADLINIKYSSKSIKQFDFYPFASEDFGNGFQAIFIVDKAVYCDDNSNDDDELEED